MTLRSRRLERDLYGCATIEEQYKGHAQLPPGTKQLVQGDAILGQAEYIVNISKLPDIKAQNILDDQVLFSKVHRAAAKHAHPDHNGSIELITALNNAKAAIYEYKGWS